MFDDDAKYQLAGTSSTAPGMPLRQTRRERLEVSKRQLEMHLTNINEAIKALDDNPNIEDVINKIDRAL